jgi:YidC/Oxa1 family membrane protein insertase
MKAMSDLSPKMKIIQAKYSEDKAKQQQEIMKMYREKGMNPLGCLGPMIVQMPIFFGLFWSLRATLISTPERLSELSEKLYTWLPQVHSAIPIDSTFLWMDLGEYSRNSQYPYLLPILVGVSTWLMQKMSSSVATTPQQESTNRLMLWMMPAMFGFFTLNFENGLALYWIMSNLIGILIQGFITGWDPLLQLLNFRKKQVDDNINKIVATEEVVANEEDRNIGEDDRRRDRNRIKGARRKSKRSRNRGN